jgi:hypothetical protein
MNSLKSKFLTKNSQKSEFLPILVRKTGFFVNMY